MEHALLKARLTRSILLSEKTKHLEFEVEDAPAFDFVPGQFISVREPRGEKFITRAYSLASPPRADNTFDLCLNRVDEGFMSNYLCDRAVGDVVNLHGPHGVFVLKPDVDDMIFVATGTGVAPFRSMAQHLFGRDGSGQDRHYGRQVHLVYGTRYPEDVYYRQEFEQLAAEEPDFHYTPTLSRPPESWSGARGYVQEHVRQIVGERKDMHVYICGLNEMVSATRKLLIEECGWEKKRVIYERYD
ncbi:MAG: FAD-dependent oxidoreductase [Acidobacteriota bacterium]|nr:FAD-dependent oxidoreductase [Acidobacteriota bacterium]